MEPQRPLWSKDHGLVVNANLCRYDVPMIENHLIPTRRYAIRHAMTHDLEQACAVDQEAFSPYGTAESPAIIKARWMAYPQGFFVANSDHGIVGYATSEKWLSECEPTMDEDPFLSHHPDGRYFCITAMAVRAAWRQQGIAAALLDRLVKLAKEENCLAIVLETTHAQSFYQKRGFHVAGQRDQMQARLFIMRQDLQAA